MLAALCWLFALAPSGDPPRNRNAVGFAVAVGGASRVDSVFSPLRYAGAGGGGELSYAHRASNGRHAFEIWSLGGVARNRHRLPALLVHADFRYGYAHRVHDGRLAIFLGGAIGGGPRIQLFQIEDSDHLYWSTAYALDARLQLEWRLPAIGVRRLAQSITARIDLPVVGVGSRPPPSVTYNNDKPSAGYLLRRMHSAPRFVSFHNRQAFRGRVGWSLVLSRHIEQAIEFA